MVFVLVVERVLDAVGVGGGGLNEENSQEQNGFAIHGDDKCKQEWVNLGDFL